ncbi:MAG TPA: hypothetical protein DD379_24655 [Cyanobacteria bacterium UBA11162]|nr:hypothetical protein [Cyanobacteria bacterium UBA11162]
MSLVLRHHSSPINNLKFLPCLSENLISGEVYWLVPTNNQQQTTNNQQPTTNSMSLPSSNGNAVNVELV